jgi:acetyl-CoA acetyltransferase
MPEAFIVDAVRTPVGRRGGGLAAAHPADLGAHVIAALLARTQADPLAVDDVVFGCVDAVGPQAGDIARTAWLAAGLPEAVPGVTVDRQCGSSQQAVHFAAQAVLSGTADLVVAGGVQNMSMIPIASAVSPPYTDPFSGSDGWRARYEIDLIEINEAFAPVVLAWQRETGADLARGERLRRGDRARPPARRHRRPAADHAAARAGADRRPLWPGHHVRGRRPGQRDDHRAPVIQPTFTGSKPAARINRPTSSPAR